QLQKGFILFITLMMLIVFAISGIALYQQTTTSTLNVQYVTFKQEAEDLAIQALNELELHLKDKAKYTQRDVCTVISDSANEGELANKATNCDPITDETINAALTELRETGGLTGSTPNKPGWDHLSFKDFNGSFSGDGGVFYIIQQLGLDEKDDYLLFRITIISRVLDTYSVISSVSAVPAKE
ncbi:MAG: hypothetical protein ACRCXK_06025, partial [Wohlfahrtiimonas sp.]